MKQQYPFTKDDLRLKRQWLIAFALPNLLCLLLLIFSLFAVKTFEDLFKVIISVITFIPPYLLYNCAYRRPGTRLLTFNLITTMPIMLIPVFFAFKNLLLQEAVVVSFIVLSYTVWISIASIKLRRINLRVRKELIKAQAVDDIAEINKITNLDDLKSAVDALICKSPRLQPVLLEAFEDKKRELSLTDSCL
ncbi:MAG: hypothetical protein P4L16_00495 [Chlamydiales bacterium]|nr:hypothetical protein [Chlamydiales bacterium]